MNMKILAQAIGGFVLLLGIAGLAMGERQLANMTNIDIMLDITRITLGALLIGSSLMGAKAIRSAFAIFGVAYLGAFLAAIVSPNMFGLLPHEFGPVDNLLHLAGGVLGLGIALLPESATRGRFGSTA
jgi:hypothetical protein